jgi:hypothetical protein
MRVLLGFLLKGEVDAMFKQQPFELPGGETDYFNSWRKSSDAVRRLSPTPSGVDVGVIDETQCHAAREVKSRPTFARYYEALDDYQFALVPITGLLTPQAVADFDYIEELAGQISVSSSLDDLVRFTMADGHVTQPIVRGAQVIFNSVRPDLHADQVPVVREVGQGDFEIVVRANSRPNYVQVAVIGNRLLLINGVHRACALYLRRHERVPCLLRKLSRIEESGLNLQTSLFRPELLNGVRPAQVIDFLDHTVAVPLKQRAMHNVLRVGIGVEMMQVPAIAAATGSRTERDSRHGPSLQPLEESGQPGARA